MVTLAHDYYRNTDEVSHRHTHRYKETDTQTDKHTNRKT